MYVEQAVRGHYFGVIALHSTRKLLLETFLDR